MKFLCGDPTCLECYYSDRATAKATAADEYYSPSKKTVFVPVAVEYHEPTDIVYWFSIEREDTVPNGHILLRADVDKEIRPSGSLVRKMIEAEIKLYEKDWEEADNCYDGNGSDKLNMHGIESAIKALKLLANKF